MQTSINNTRESHDDYQPMLDAVRTQFERAATGPFFTTDVTGEALWRAYLDGLPTTDERQGHNCHACRRFVQAYGGLVTVDADGFTHAAMFGIAPGMYYEAFDSMRRLVERARITGVYLTSETVLGTPATRDGKRQRTWYHMHVAIPSAMRYRGVVLNADQRAAELREDYSTLCRALGEFKAETITQALAIAQSEALYRAEKIEGRLKWLADLCAMRDNYRGRQQNNLVWAAVAKAPAGFCHVRSSVVGSLLEDLEAGKSFEAVKRAFDAKMHPLQYQRPTAPPSAGNVKQAEAIVEKLGSAGALRRRFARLADVKTVWTPKTEANKPADGSVFGHLLKQNPSAPLAVRSATAMTWAKFERTVLPTAELMTVHAPAHGHYTAFVTAADPDAPPIIQWDISEGRNPVTWYTYSGGSPAARWNLKSGPVRVTAISEMPNMWQPKFEHHGKGVLFALEGCRDSNNASSCLFPELLKSEYHPVRSTIEAFSNRAKLEGAEQAEVCGLPVRAGNNANLRVTVQARGTLTEYVIDRWD